jgi:putative oxidoreductase
MLKRYKLDLASLTLRLFAGALMLTHGIPKLLHFSERMETFADPFGLGSMISLTLVVFAEVFCSVFLIIGLKVRWSVIPLIITMLVAIFYAHWDDPFGRKELPLMFICCYVSLFLLGGGKFGIDGMLFKKSTA